MIIVCAGCDNNEFSCANGDCIPARQECDGSLDCTDRSDEHSDCGKKHLNIMCALNICTYQT